MNKILDFMKSKYGSSNPHRKWWWSATAALFIVAAISSSVAPEDKQNVAASDTTESVDELAFISENEEIEILSKVGFEFGLTPEFQELWEIDPNSPTGTRCTSLSPESITFKMMVNGENVTTNLHNEDEAPLGWRGGKIVASSHLGKSYFDWEDLSSRDREKLVNSDGVGACVGLQTVTFRGEQVGTLEVYINDKKIKEEDGLIAFPSEEQLLSRRSTQKMIIAP